MYEGSAANLKMEQRVLEDSIFDETGYPCEVITYQEEEERIFLLSKEAELPTFSLDGIYRCSITGEKETQECTGVVLERYWNKVGRVLVFQVKNGFYKKF